MEISYDRDDILSTFAKKTLKESYMVEGEDSPQEAYARAAKAFSDNDAHAQRMYDYISKHWMTLATPVLSNGGTERGQPISCFLNYTVDSREGFANHNAENIFLASSGGGIGGYWGEVRSNGSSTSKGSQSNGIVPPISATAHWVAALNQGKVRRGAYAAYLDVNHPEIKDFIAIRKPGGSDDRRIRNRKVFHHAVNITDEFMNKVMHDEYLDLIDPKSKEVTDTIRARELWDDILRTRLETGEPYLHFIDNSNKYINPYQKEKGLKINQSNLCVAPETKILTSEGYVTISGYKGKEVEAWNGQEWSTVKIKKTSLNKQKLLNVKFSDGSELDCTKYHKFYVQDGYNKSSVRAVEAKDLKPGMKLEKWELPDDITFFGVRYIGVSAYSQGFYSGEGNKGLHHSWLYKEKYMCQEKLIGEFGEEQKGSKRKIWKHGDMLSKDFVPNNDYDKKECLEWLSGYLDADGTVVKSDNGDTIQVASIDQPFLKKVKELLEMLGVHSRIALSREDSYYSMPDSKEGEKDSLCQNIFHLVINTSGTKKLLDLGLHCLRLQFQDNQNPQREDSHYIKVLSVEDKGRMDHTYCAHEPLRNRLTFNGVVTGNCSEILLPTGIDYKGMMRTAVCCLSSLNLSKWEEWKDDTMFIEDVVRFLDNVLSSFIEKNISHPHLRHAAYSAMMERSIGLGTLGFHSLLMKKMIPFESAMATSLNNKVFKHIKEKAVEASKKLVEEGREEPEDIKGSGMRHAHLLAIAPNASTSILVGESPSIEPLSANAYTHVTNKGSFRIRNKYLKMVLEDYNMNNEEVWQSIEAHDGSVQHLTKLSQDVKDVFKTAFELDQRWVIEHAATRQPYICQGQSVNLFFKPNVPAKVLRVIHRSAWQKGLKTLYYVRSTSPGAAENVAKDLASQQEDYQRELHNTMSQNSDCLSCEG